MVISRCYRFYAELFASDGEYIERYKRYAAHQHCNFLPKLATRCSRTMLTTFAAVAFVVGIAFVSVKKQSVITRIYRLALLVFEREPSVLTVTK